MEIVNHEYYVSLVVAKLLKEAGFDWETRSYYTDNKVDGKSILLYGYNNSIANWNAKQFFMRDCDGSIFVNNGTYRDSITGDYITSSFFSAPTLEVAQRWLREVKDIYVNSVLCVNRGTSGHSFGISITEVSADLSTVKILYPSTYFDEEETKGFMKYEVCLEAGIKKALELILKKGE